MSRFAALIVAVLLAVAAPLKTWCEASCLDAAATTQPTGKSHCPQHDSTSGPAMSAADGGCPVIDTARPVPAKIDIAPPAMARTWATVAPQHLSTSAPQHLSTRAPQHLIRIPLRI